MDILKQLEAFGIVPVVKLDDAGRAVPLAKALCRGGLACAEITFRTAAAENAIRDIAKNVPELLLGAGTVLTAGQAEAAAGAGARFIVTPDFNPEVIKYCADKGITVIPNASSPSEVARGAAMGLSVLKFFPAEACGGLPMIKALSGPFPRVRFMPTGGIDLKNLAEYAACPLVAACGGSFMVRDFLINEGRFDKITELAREAVRAVMGFEFRQLGINAASSDEAEAAARFFSGLFGFAGADGGAYVAMPGLEFTQGPSPGDKGHIGVSANSAFRAYEYLKRLGVEFDESTARADADGRLRSVYLKARVAGFAVRITGK